MTMTATILARREAHQHCDRSRGTSAFHGDVHRFDNIIAALLSTGNDELRGQSTATREAFSICAAKDTSTRLRLLKDSLLPPSAYLFWKYPDARPTWTPVLQFRRWIAGIRKRFAASVRKTVRLISSPSRLSLGGLDQR
jgi:hypothetical protein